MNWDAPTLIAGVDEAGRGPLAGPVFAAAVILDDLVPNPGLADSKKLSAKVAGKAKKSSKKVAAGKANAYIAFVKKEYANVKKANPSLASKDIMKLLGKLYKKKSPSPPKAPSPKKSSSKPKALPKKARKPKSKM